jgi:hypothetical protein
MKNYRGLYNSFLKQYKNRRQQDTLNFPRVVYGFDLDLEKTRLSPNYNKKNNFFPEVIKLRKIYKPNY